MSAQQKEKSAGVKPDAKNPADNGNKEVLSAIQMLAERMSKPRKVVRGADGKIAGVE